MDKHDTGFAPNALKLPFRIPFGPELARNFVEDAARVRLQNNPPRLDTLDKEKQDRFAGRREVGTPSNSPRLRHSPARGYTRSSAIKAVSLTRTGSTMTWVTWCSSPSISPRTSSWLATIGSSLNFYSWRSILTRLARQVRCLGIKELSVSLGISVGYRYKLKRLGNLR